MVQANHTFFRGGDNGAVNNPVLLSVGQALNLANVEVRIDFGALVFSLRVVCQDASSRLGMRLNGVNFAASFAYGDSTHGVDQDRSRAGLLEPGLETPQNSFGSLEVVSISLRIPNTSRQPSALQQDYV